MKDGVAESNVFSNLRWKAFHRHIPYIVTFELTYRCNLKCTHCYLTPGDPHEEEMPALNWIRTIRELADLGTFYVTVTGGEPTLYPGFWDILDELHRRETVIRVFTNATTLTEEDVDRLIRCGVRYVDISLHGPDAATHEAITRTPGSFSRTIEAVKRLRAAGVYVNLKGCLLRSNFRRVNELDRFMLSLGGQPMISSTITPANDGGTGPLETALNTEEYCFIYDNYYREDNEPTETGKERILPVMGCTAGFSTLSVAPDGEVFPCLQLRVSMGNVRRNTLRRIWHHAPLNLYLSGLMQLAPPGCLGCELADSCMRCPGLALIETGSLWKPSPSACQAASNYKSAHTLHLSRKGNGNEQEELHPTESNQ
ncbi:MAG: radical SAM protein [bacterium]|nr:radical SAM protein [bacterium]